MFKRITHHVEQHSMLQQTGYTTNNKNRYTDRHLSNVDTQSRLKLLQTGIKAQVPNSPRFKFSLLNSNLIT